MVNTSACACILGETGSCTTRKIVEIAVLARGWTIVGAIIRGGCVGVHVEWDAGIGSVWLRTAIRVCQARIVLEGQTFCKPIVYRLGTKIAAGREIVNFCVNSNVVRRVPAVASIDGIASSIGGTGKVI